MMTLKWIKERVGARLRAHRALAKLTLREAAPKIEITFQQLNRIETGKNSPRLATLMRAAMVYGCLVRDFLVDVDEQILVGQQAGGYLVDEQAAARANIVELTRALAYLTDLAEREVREEDARLFREFQEEIAKLRKRTTGGGG